MAKLNSAKLSQQIIPTFPPFLRIRFACVDWCFSNSSTSCFSSLPWHHPLCLPLCAVQLLHYFCDLPIVLSELAVLCPKQIAHLQKVHNRPHESTLAILRGFRRQDNITKNKQHFKGRTNLHKAAICGLNQD